MIRISLSLFNEGGEKMRSALAAMITGAALLSSGQAFADKADEIGQCLIAHSTPETEAVIKKMLIAALEDDTDALNSTALQLGVQILSNAQANCGLKLSDVNDPSFQKAAGKYGEFLGQKIVGAAFAKLGGAGVR